MPTGERPNRSAFMQLKNVRTDLDLKYTLGRVRFIKYYIWSILPHGADGWAWEMTGMKKTETPQSNLSQDA